MRKITLRPAVPGDAARGLLWDHHLPRERFRELTETGRALWICGGEEKAGLLRWGYFWDEIPFLNLIWLHESCRGEGAGRAAMALWEDSLRKAGCRAAMTSTQADEGAQHFYRKLGYRDTGSLILTLPGFEQPTELILIKPLTG